jgi:hypothetical protein
MTMKYVKPERLFLSDHPELNERWVQERIAEDPSLLGLGDLVERFLYNVSIIRRPPLLLVGTSSDTAPALD